MSIRNRLLVYIVSLFFVCGAVIAGSIYLILPLYTGLIQPAAVMDTLKGIIIVIVIAGSLIILYALICAIMMAVFVARSVVPPLNALVKLAEEIREGNLDYHIEYAKGDEFESVFREFDAMRKKLKRSLTETAEVNDNRKEMIASLAHDIKTPVTSICAYAEGLRDGIAQTAEARARYTETILEKARLVDSLVNDLFIFSKLDIRQDSLALQEVNAADFLKALFEEAAKNEAYKLTYEPAGLENEIIMINPTAFARVIQNITQNSVYHSNAGSIIIRVSARIQDNNVLVKITDNGVGVDAEECEHVFDRFYQSDRSRSGSGSGLGLTICRRLIEGMNGKIWARSGRGEGFTVCITLPVFYSNK